MPELFSEDEKPITSPKAEAVEKDKAPTLYDPSKVPETLKQVSLEIMFNFMDIFKNKIDSMNVSNVADVL